MVLFSMITTDEDALICDLAETYGVFDYKGLPLNTVAVLACGLRDNSRIMLKMSRMKVKTETLLLAMAVDELRILAWQNTKDGQRGRNIPNSIAKQIMGIEDKNNQHEIYASGEDFDAAWKAIVGD